VGTALQRSLGAIGIVRPRLPTLRLCSVNGNSSPRGSDDPAIRSSCLILK
jgi:hypothetical protein